MTHDSAPVPQSIPSLTVFGPGLLGGSLLHDARRMGIPHIRVWARRQEAVDEVMRMKLADFGSCHAKEVAEGSSFIVLASPVGSFASLAASIVEARLAPEAVVTDVGSVKAMVHAGAGKIFREAGIPFVGSHPMAGAERKGLGAATAGLFEGAACILTNDGGVPSEVVARVAGFWKQLGSRVSSLNAQAHDQIMARISHLPHLTAAALTLAALRTDVRRADFAGGGLRDTTRVASGDPEMWQEILMENREALAQPIREIRDILGDLLEMLENVEHERLFSVLREAKALREIRYPNH